MDLINKSNNVFNTTEMHNKNQSITGKYIYKFGERYYEIKNSELMENFFMTIVSDSDHWLFAASNGGISAGRINSNIVLFPYITVDKIYDSVKSTGPMTAFFIHINGRRYFWEPFSVNINNQYLTQKSIYKNIPGDKVVFQVTNLDLKITYSYMWATSEKYGFIKKSFLENHNETGIYIEVLDGVRNIMPAQVDPGIQLKSSCLANAYKQNELDIKSGMGIYGMASQITDRPKPKESLRANIAWSAGLPDPVYLISEMQLTNFAAGRKLFTETSKNGIRGAYFINSSLTLNEKSYKEWIIAMDVYKTQESTVNIKHEILTENDILSLVEKDIIKGTINLKKIIASADGLQTGNKENTTAHHFSNVLFNCMRGGVFENGYKINKYDLVKFVKIRNHPIYNKFKNFFMDLNNTITKEHLLEKANIINNPDLIRLCMEYLPLIFSRRHGGPSRPWNEFAIHIKDEQNKMIYNYQGNWRDIFQNWEALLLSFPCFIENIIAKFVNASTVDGYNPYRITYDGIDWEKINPDDPWSNIGYWGDHQVIYLLKLLEWYNAFFPGELEKLLSKEIFSYANVPYKINSYNKILQDPYNTIEFDEQKEKNILKKMQTIGTDAKLVLDNNGNVYHVNLIEKLIILILTKLINFVPGGGIWLNTQRPEWNDANNALTGYGLSMVTLYYLRRFINFLNGIIPENTQEEIFVSTELVNLFTKVEKIYNTYSEILISGNITDIERKSIIDSLQKSGSEYRQNVYENGFSGKSLFKFNNITLFLKNILSIIDRTIKENKRDDGLYNAYNLIKYTNNTAKIEYLYEMLEGQTAVLSSFLPDAEDSLDITAKLRGSKMFRQDQYSYTLYPDKKLPGFFEKNIIPDEKIKNSNLLNKLIDEGSNPIITRDISGVYRFGAECSNAKDVEKLIDLLAENPDYKKLVNTEKKYILDLYEEVFNHHSFTGRSGAMYGYEGLGSIYWHMVSKLLLAVQENYFKAVESNADNEICKKLAFAYYDIRNGLGFNKSPDVYGAFPSDPYSHTPSNSGARQPGMTGQVKEEIITRFGELGVRIKNGCISFNTALLKKEEFLVSSSVFTYKSIKNEFEIIKLKPGQIGFTFCQTPIIYNLADKPGIQLHYKNKKIQKFDNNFLTKEISNLIFRRTGDVKKIDVNIINLLDI